MAMNLLSLRPCLQVAGIKAMLAAEQKARTQAKSFGQFKAHEKGVNFKVFLEHFALGFIRLQKKPGVWRVLIWRLMMTLCRP